MGIARRTTFLRYAVGLVIAAAGLLLAVLLNQHLHTGIFFIYVAVLISAALGGRGPGLVTTALGVLVGAYLLTPDPDSGADADLTFSFITLALGGAALALLSSWIYADRRAAIWSDSPAPVAPEAPVLEPARVKAVSADHGQVQGEDVPVTTQEEAQPGLDQIADDQQVLEQALQDAQARYRAVLSEATDAMLVVDADGRYVDANAAAATLLGCPLEDLLAGPIGYFQPIVSSWTAADRATFVRQGHWRGEMMLQRKDGSSIWVEARVSAVVLSTDTIYLASLREVGGDEVDSDRGSASDTPHAERTDFAAGRRRPGER